MRVTAAQSRQRIRDVINLRETFDFPIARTRIVCCDLRDLKRGSDGYYPEPAVISISAPLL